MTRVHPPLVIGSTSSPSRRSSSGDHLSVTPDNLSPGLGPGGGGLLANRGAHRSLSNIESASTGNGGQRSSGSSTSYHSSTLPLRKQRNKVSAEEKNKKVCGGGGGFLTGS